MATLEQKLKNPVWHSLNETHKKFKIEFDGVHFYKPDILTFGGFIDATKTKKALNQFVKSADTFFLVSENKDPIIDASKVILEKKIDGCQMVLDSLIDLEITEKIVLLTEEYLDEIYNLIWLVMPGFYQKNSFELGNYYGIFKDDKLVAITGQRMQTDSFIEVSAVVTHPDFTKRGLAKQLVTHTTKEILKENKLPILHTNKGNPAIFLYEKLGYKITRDMNWWLYNKK
ncbi:MULTISPECIES: GNAT family N-acetyltransferase [unclassified Polaribacter]|uniref:GNAT family N-acetyltransferase n=1 Tax=unclassified Polaribacter TaxID=196858 RepID=UPI0011BD5782|nr:MULTISPECIES: GNAT family N-acetyltransferase [unclassified Polaribacter]TXD53609.1 GNAT family N-acetyltransferase [Polaribacter sp. IC063]TXD62150.1 GNAT family N-acetyltransferase [Polaribacter sp. IC066]